MPVAGADEILELVNVGPIVRAEGLLEVLREPDSALGVDPEVDHRLLTLVSTSLIVYQAVTWAETRWRLANGILNM